MDCTVTSLFREEWKNSFIDALHSGEGVEKYVWDFMSKESSIKTSSGDRHYLGEMIHNYIQNKPLLSENDKKQIQIRLSDAYACRFNEELDLEILHFRGVLEGAQKGIYIYFDKSFDTARFRLLQEKVRFAEKVKGLSVQEIDDAREALPKSLRDSFPSVINLDLLPVNIGQLEMRFFSFVYNSSGRYKDVSVLEQYMCQQFFNWIPQITMSEQERSEVLADPIELEKKIDALGLKQTYQKLQAKMTILKNLNEQLSSTTVSNCLQRDL